MTDLKDKHVVLAGRFPDFPGYTLKRRLIDKGAILRGSITGKTALLITGQDASGNKLDEARRRHIDIMDSAALRVFLGIEDTNSRLATLRDLLHRDPSPEAWEALCEAFDTWPEGEDLQLALDCAYPHLNTWPDHLRVAPDRWLRFKEPRLPLAVACNPPEDGAPGRLWYHTSFKKARRALDHLGAAREAFGISQQTFDDLTLYKTHPDGRRLVREGNELKIKGARNKILARTFITDDMGPEDVEAHNFSRCGRYVLHAGHESDHSFLVRLFDADTLETLDTFRPEYETTFFLATIHLDPHTDVITVINHESYNRDGELFLLRIEGGRFVALPGAIEYSEQLTFVGFTPDLDLTITCSSGNVVLWDRQTGESCSEDLDPDYLEGYGRPNLSFGGSVGRWALIPLESYTNFTFRGLLVYDHETKKPLGVIPETAAFSSRYFKVLGQRLVLLHSGDFDCAILLQFLPSTDIFTF